jgi:acetyl esterase
VPPLERAESFVLRAALGLPEPVQRVLAGRPVVRDGQTLATDVQLMLRLQQVVRERAVETLPVPQGRVALRRQARLAGGRQPVGGTRDLVVAGRPARLYTPSTVVPGPLLLFLHGGGFVFGDLASHDAPCRFLAERSGVRVLAVDYRLAPEDPFPAAYDDALAAHRWVVEHADELAVDRDRLGVGGDSAGGNLAAGVAIEAARAGLPLAWQLLVYPATDARHPFESARMFGEGLYLTTAFMDLANAGYVGDGDQTDPRVSPLLADLDGLGGRLAPAYVATAGFDPLRDEGEAYARRLVEAGAEVELRRFTSQIHGFLNVVGAGRSARAANATIAAAVRAALVERRVERRS